MFLTVGTEFDDSRYTNLNSSFDVPLLYTAGLAGDSRWQDVLIVRETVLEPVDASLNSCVYNHSHC